jgi:DNA-binding CsgD family transcriptional regulator
MTNRLIHYAYCFGVLLYLFSPASIPAQGVNVGIPPMRNFPKKIYQAGTQNWDAAQDRRGVMYWANNEGLLLFDGTTWTCLPVANHTIVRSVAIDSSDRIFTGAQSELGYFEPGFNGVLAYHSLVQLLPESQRSFEDVWDIVFWMGDVFFRTNRVVFRYSHGTIQTYTPGGDLTALYATPRGLIVQQGLTDILTFRNNAFEPLLRLPELQSSITGIMAWQGDTLLISSLKNGLFYLTGNQSGRWATPYDGLIQEKRIYSATRLPGFQLALGTSLDGLIILDRHRRIFRHLTKKNGLQNNNILSTFSDRAGNLWLGLDSGIDCIILDSPFSSVIPDGDLQGTGYAAAVYQGRIYFGVSNGAWSASWQPFYNPERGPVFQKIPSTDGQVWGLKVLGDELLLGHHEGAFQLKGVGVSQLSAVAGAWTFVQMSDDYLLGGTYNGLVLYRKTDHGWQFVQKMEGLEESCRIMVRDQDGSVWVSHPYRGLYHVVWTPGQPLLVRFYNSANGLPTNLNNYVFQIAGKAVFATEKGIYRYNREADQFVQDEDFNKALGDNSRIRYLKEDPQGNIWYVTATEVGLLEVHDLGLKKEVRKAVFPELAGKLVGGFEMIYPIDERNVIFGAEQGFIHYDPSVRQVTDTVVQVVLSKVSTTGLRDSVLFGGWFAHTGAEMPGLDADLNNLRFVFSATDFKNPEFIRYRVRLIGLNPEWSGWSVDPEQHYTNLSPGVYTFQIQARRKDGRESGIVSYSFRIRPPWYASTAAFFLYAVALALLVAGFLARQRRQFESEKAALTVRHQEKEAAHLLAVEQSRAALTDIQNEKLEAEIRFKNQELASATMHLVQKGEILLTIQEALNQILEKSTNPAVKKEVQQLLNLLNFDAKLDDDWEQFAFHFDQVHVDFLKRLREKYPQLSSNDHKLCAYLRMNLSTKETAPLMNISVRGVEASRYRLRKKLNLSNDANLTDFMMEV